MAAKAGLVPTLYQGRVAFLANMNGTNIFVCYTVM